MKALVHGFRVKTAQTESNYLEQLKQIQKEHSSEHGPMFSKYLGKALEHVKPIEVPKGKEAYDENGLAKYDMIVNSAKILGKAANDQWKMTQKLYSNHVEIHGLYKKISIVHEELSKFVNRESNTILINDDSKKLLEKLEEFHDEMKDLVIKGQALIEDGFDTVGGVEL